MVILDRNLKYFGYDGCSDGCTAHLLVCIFPLVLVVQWCSDEQIAAGHTIDNDLC